MTTKIIKYLGVLEFRYPEIIGGIGGILIKSAGESFSISTFIRIPSLSDSFICLIVLSILYFCPRTLAMNILFLTFQGDIAGSTYSISYLARGLAKKSHSVYVGCRKESLLYAMLESSDVKLIPMTFRGRLDITNMKQIRDAVKEYSIQIINAQSSYDRYTSVLAKWLFRLDVKVVHTRRQVSKSMGGPILNFVLVNGTDRIVAVSEGVKVSLVKSGFPEDHVTIIHNGTPHEKYENINTQLTKELREKFQISTNDFVVGCVSRLKNQEQILQAFSRLSFKVKAIFVGINKQPHWDDIIDGYKISHDLYFTGLVSMDTILSYYKLFDVKILASTMEGLSQSLLEAMSLGTPVIATNASGNPELISHGVNGLLFEDGDDEELAEQITELFQNENLRKTLSENGKKTAREEFNINNTVRNFENLFQQLLTR